MSDSEFELHLLDSSSSDETDTTLRFKLLQTNFEQIFNFRIEFVELHYA